MAGACGEKNDDAQSVYSVGSQVPATARQRYQDAVRNNVEMGEFGVTGVGLGAIPEEEIVEVEVVEKGPYTEIDIEIEKKYAPENLTWAQVDQYSAMLHERDSSGNWAGKIGAQMSLRETLDKQVFDKAHRIAKESKDGDKYYSQMMEDIELHKSQEEDKIAERKEKNLKEKNDRMQQIKLQAVAREEKKVAARREEEAMVQKCLQELKKEKVNAEKKKHQQILMMKKLQEDNIKDQAVKAAQAEADRIADQKEQENQNRLREKQEADRKEAMDKRAEKQAILLKKMQDTVGTAAASAQDKEYQVRPNF